MSNVTISVIDTSCEAADQSFFPPKVALSTKSTTKIATVRGYSEFPGFESSPPKKFKTIVWSGSSEQQLWYQGVQIGGARYDFGGIDQIDDLGVVVGTHNKFLSLMCDGPQDRANIIGPIYPNNTSYSFADNFLGYFGTNSTYYPNLFGPTELCSSASVPYSPVGDKAVKTPFQAPLYDLNGLWGSGSAGGQNSFMGKAVVVVQGSTNASSNDSGTTAVVINPYALPLIPPGIILESFSELVTPIGTIPRPPDWSGDAQVIYTNTFSAALQDEYTDALALAHATVINGNGAVAQNFPRTTGFVSTTTSVTYSLFCTNLVAGSNYLVTVDLADLTSGTLSHVQVGFTANATTHTVNGSIPTPSAGHSVQVRNPSIQFA